MTRRFSLAFFTLTLCLSTFGASFAGPVEDLKAKLAKALDESAAAPDKAKSFAKETLIKECTNPIFVAACKASAAKDVSIEQLKKIEQDWVTAESELPIQSEVLHNECANELRRISSSNAVFGKVLIADARYATIAANDMTNNYYQASKAKFKDAYNNGDGGVFVDKPHLDKSTNVPIMQISLPVIDEDGKAIGVICWGLKSDKL